MKNKYLTVCKFPAEHRYIFQAAENQALWIENQPICVKSVSAYQLNLFNPNVFYWISMN